MLSSKRWCYAVWVIFIGAFAVLHALNLRADFPNHSPWWMDWAKYTDEGWYGNAAVRAHLNGNWYLAGDFNPAAAVPAWPCMEWLVFFATGVTVQAARGLAVAFFFASLVLSYLLLRTRGPRWVALLALTLMVTSPFLYCFSRLAILEPMLVTVTLGALNLGVRLPGFRRPVLVSAGIGVLFALMMLTKTTAVFLLPAVAWSIVWPLWRNSRKCALRCALAAAAAFAASYAAWLALVARSGLLPDYEHFFLVNRYIKPKEFYWPLVSLWWSFHGGLWVDHILIPLAGLVAIGAALAWKSARGRGLLLDPVFGAALLAVAGTIFFMTYQDHPQPRYFTLVGFFSFVVVAQGAGALLGEPEAPTLAESSRGRRMTRSGLARLLSWPVVGLTAVAATFNGFQTLNYAAHPEYTFVDAAERLTRYIDEHPNGKRLLVSVSGDQIALVTHLPTINDLFIGPSPEMSDLATKLAYYEPGWFAAWNYLDLGTLEDLHSRYSVEQVASFRAFDDPSRNVLVLFKLHPWPGGRVRDAGDENLHQPFPEDKFNIPLE